MKAKRKRFKGWWWVAITVSVILSLILLPAPPDRVEGKGYNSPIKVNIDHLADLYEFVPEEAKQKYTHRYVITSGYVQTVTRTFGSNNVLSAISDDQGRHVVHLEFRKNQSPKAMSLKRGDKITVKCRCDGYALIAVTLVDCEISKIQ